MGNFFDDQEQRDIISKNLIILIENTNKRQADIAVELNVNPPTFNQWVNGKAIPSISMLKKLAAYFKVPLTSIVDPQNTTDESFVPTPKELDMIAKYRHLPTNIKHTIETLIYFDYTQ